MWRRAAGSFPGACCLLPMSATAFAQSAKHFAEGAIYDQIAVGR
jgi:hypothetical protein